MKRAMFSLKQIIVMVLLLIVIAGFFILIYKHYSSNSSAVIQDQAISTIRPSSMEVVDAKTIAYLLVDLGAGRLHKNPFGFENPIVCVKVDKKEYLATISKTIEIKEQNCSKQDIEIITTSQEILNAFKGNVKEYMKDSVWNDRTNIELIAGKVELFAKGYADLYYNFG